MHEVIGFRTAQNSIKTQNRDFGIDILKSIAIISVIMIHSSTGWYSFEIGSFHWMSNMLWASVSRAGVPVFLMCSGALLLNPQKEFGLKKLFLKNLLRIIASMLFWGMLYKIYHLLGSGNLSLNAFLVSFKELVLFKHEFHLYYLHIIILVYVFLPVTRIFAANAGEKQMRYFLLLWFLLAIIYPTVKPFWPFNQLYGIPAQWLMNMTYASIGYGVLGYYLRFYPPPGRKIYIGLIIAGFMFVFFGTYYLSHLYAEFYSGFLEGMSFGTALMAAGIFGCFSRPRKNRENFLIVRISVFLSDASFCIYLVHVFFIYIFNAAGFTIYLFPDIVSIPVIASVILLCSCGVYAALSRIPVVKRWLV